MTTATSTEDIRVSGLILRLTIERSYNTVLGYPDDRMASKGRVVSAKVLEVVDEEKAYNNLSQLKRA